MKSLPMLLEGLPNRAAPVNPGAFGSVPAERIQNIMVPAETSKLVVPAIVIKFPLVATNCITPDRDLVPSELEATHVALELIPTRGALAGLESATKLVPPVNESK